MKEKENLSSRVSDQYSLRCCKCNFEFVRSLSISDNVSDLVCPNCPKGAVELNLGKKVRK